MEIEMRVLHVVPILLLSCSAASAYEPYMNLGQGVICDTLNQVERFAALRSEGKNAEGALQAVNNDITGHNACASHW